MRIRQDICTILPAAIKLQKYLLIDSGANVSDMGRSFKMIEESGMFANMTGFANDLRLVATVDNSVEMLDMNLEVKDGLLAIECSYPSNLLCRFWSNSDQNSGFCYDFADMQ
eukprot:11729841-Ditylum_brightwellii.AAC.1